MIKFFRKIRQKLLIENKVSKYVLYAIGEILLIIIGVVIAISATQWKSDKKDSIYEKEALNEIYKGLQLDYAKLELLQKNTEKGIERITILDSLLKEKAPVYSSSLDPLFGAVYGFRFFSMEKANYEDLKLNSLNLIKNRDLRRQLIIVFESEYSTNDKIYEIEIWVNEILRSYYLENFQNIRFQESATPLNYEKLWSDSYYKNIVAYRLTFLKGVINRDHVRFKNEMEKLMKLIEAYIEIK
ncbi:hypothetical protein [Lutibacter sp.]|uniref:hypothetical protein n=1 Tax=Lutibacter sp. TaxID=1925666 RepID=UPI0034A0960D